MILAIVGFEALGPNPVPTRVVPGVPPSVLMIGLSTRWGDRVVRSNVCRRNLVSSDVPSVIPSVL